MSKLNLTFFDDSKYIVSGLTCNVKYLIDCIDRCDYWKDRYHDLPNIYHSWQEGSQKFINDTRRYLDELERRYCKE